MYPNASSLFNFGLSPRPRLPVDPFGGGTITPGTMPGKGGLWGGPGGPTDFLRYDPTALDLASPTSYDAAAENRARSRVMEDYLARMARPRSQASYLFGFNR